MIKYFIGVLYNKYNITFPLGDAKFLFPSWKYFTRSLRLLVKHFSTREEIFGSFAWPCNIFFCLTFRPTSKVFISRENNHSCILLSNCTRYGKNSAQIEYRYPAILESWLFSIEKILFNRLAAHAKLLYLPHLSHVLRNSHEIEHLDDK